MIRTGTTSPLPAAPRTGVPRLLIPASLTLVAGSAIWAFLPIEPPRIASAPLEVATEASSVALAELDVDSFRAPPIWVRPPPEAPAPPGVQPTPLKLQLLAVFREDGVYRAALYDPESDRLVVVAAGDTVGERRVERVQADAVWLRDSSAEWTLRLTEQQGGST